MLFEEEYTGGCTGFPQFKVRGLVQLVEIFNVDVHSWHCNTKIKPISDDYTRLWHFAYLREKMIKCKGMNPKTMPPPKKSVKGNRKKSNKEKKTVKKQK